MVKQISETRSAHATTTASPSKAPPSRGKSSKTQQQSRVHLEPVPESTASLRKKLKDKHRHLKQQEKQKKQAQRHKAKQKSRRPTSKRSHQLAEAKVAITRTSTPPGQRVKRSLRFLRRLGMAAGITGVACGGGWVALEMSLPDTTHLVAETRQQGGTLTLKSADGSVLFQSGPASRQTVSIQQIPQQLQDAFIATEDRRFFEHDGIDSQGILRAMATNLLSGEVVEGGSTITQQLARTTYLNQERSILRKLKEARLSQKIEAQLSKAEILERYLNQVYLGSGAYGIADAAWVYFGKSLDQLNLQESATLAGLPAAPSLYSPLQNPQVARERRNLVLERMLRTQAITAEAAEAAKQAPMVLNAQLAPNAEDQSPYFSAYVQHQLQQILPKHVVAQGGLTIDTTLNLKWQKSAAKTIKNVVYHEGYTQRFDQAALVSLDPRNGEIKTMVGGSEFEQSQFNRVTQAQRQPGSTFKVFVYAAAIASGLSPHDGFRDVPFIVDGYQPKNYQHTYKGWMSMTQALSKSANVPAVRALIDVGYEPTIHLARELGIQSPLQSYYSTALGANEVSLMELTRAYGAIAAQGYRTQPHGIRTVTNRQGEVLYQFQPQKQRALDSNSAAIMTWMLEQVVTSGTGKPAQIGRPVAGKTGTSENNRDLWFVGYIPQLVTGVWLGNDDNYPTVGTSATAAYTWGQFMKQVATDVPLQRFPKLPRLTNRKGSIKAKPIRPQRLRNLPMPSQEPAPTANAEETESE
ncbi:transglycosylase domain-containing protein [Acaryochloris sp. IP29b_bin.148]|uniref:transglycosylase domain-containing protein n=1 Tax=Acaryochloris sp. IP29b_bin.148 TaxID=2969218 RepID=UPI00262D44E6|nr:PBP1A family penicillin-binding protein [Acaryochloris sp. IP29b_bin.148]